MFQHGVGVEFIRFLPETHPPTLSNVFCELGACENVVSILRTARDGILFFRPGTLFHFVLPSRTGTMGYGSRHILLVHYRIDEFQMQI